MTASRQQSSDVIEKWWEGVKATIGPAISTAAYNRLFSLKGFLVERAARVLAYEKVDRRDIEQAVDTWGADVIASCPEFDAATLDAFRDQLPTLKAAIATAAGV